ncbi:hypothetical protein HG421_13455 [Xanthomonas campestris pv. badrii]|uniref:Uncharacterized protein n=1 Tax=Xanthomonas campestris pv. badrii TaxID=149696 RepID=A0A7Z2ZI05_XANCA|nr:hypothetical protein [Xanthomonas campestris]MCC4602675.1 hypothetical protein [Xanthomonas campestris pv. parthenii]QJD68607.1 hypothetical protein HG421_13455 [Xanthomonas campestris pv. badrii]
MLANGKAKSLVIFSNAPKRLALASLALPALLAVIFLRRQDTADEQRSFDSLAAAQRFAEERDLSGFDCFLSSKQGRWEVRCYRRPQSPQ